MLTSISLIASLAGLLIFVLLALTALLEYSRSRFEKLYSTRQPRLLSKILEYDDDALLALRAWGWLLVVALSFAVWRHEVVSGQEAQQAEPMTWDSALRGLLFWLLLIGLELWLARPIGALLAERILYWTWPAIDLLRISMAPVLLMHRAVRRVSFRLAGRPENGATSPIEDEILAVVNEGEREGAIREDAADMIEGLIELHEVAVSGIMTPRTDMEMLKSTATFEEARRLICDCGHSRIPVFGETRDEILGILYAKDLLPHLKNLPDAPRNLSELDLRKPVYVPEDKRVDVLLREFQRERIHVAIVLDEYGGVAGLVSIEDIIEEIVGEIDDEHDQTDEPPIHKLTENLLEVDARVHVDDINELIDVELPEDGDYDTVGGFVFSAMGRIPKTGETLRHHGALFTVLAATDRAIHRVRIENLPDGERIETSGATE